MLSIKRWASVGHLGEARSLTGFYVAAQQHRHGGGAQGTHPSDMATVQINHIKSTLHQSRPTQKRIRAKFPGFVVKTDEQRRSCSKALLYKNARPAREPVPC